MARGESKSLGTLKAESYMQASSAQAIGDSTAEPRFRAHDLNQAISDETDMLVQVGEWQACVKAEMPAKSGAVYVGIDIGGARAMTAGVLYWPDTGRMESICAFPAVPGLAERGEKDRVGSLYVDMAERGELVALGGELVDLPSFWRTHRGYGRRQFDSAE